MYRVAVFGIVCYVTWLMSTYTWEHVFGMIFAVTFETKVIILIHFPCICPEAEIWNCRWLLSEERTSYTCRLAYGFIELHLVVSSLYLYLSDGELQRKSTTVWPVHGTENSPTICCRFQENLVQAMLGCCSPEKDRMELPAVSRNRSPKQKQKSKNDRRHACSEEVSSTPDNTRSPSSAALDVDDCLTDDFLFRELS